jgi:hypothetical protein
MLRQAELSSNLLFRWRHHGMTPSPEEFPRKLWSGVLAQFLVIDRGSNRVLGVYAAFNADLANGFASIAGAKFDSGDHSTRFMEAGVLFMEMLFAGWPFRKLYMEVPGYNISQVASGIGEIFVEEGRYKDHFYLNGKYWDHHLLALYRAAWSDASPALMRFVNQP